MWTFGRRGSFVIVFLIAAVTAWGQESYQWRTAADVREGGRGRIVGSITDINEARNQFSLVPDDDSTGGVLIIADAMTTLFSGFGGVINGKPEIFTGSQGFSNMRVGDRVEARGAASSNGTVQADSITLRGRSVAAPPTGVGQTRAPGSVSVPTQTTVTQDRTNRVEGVVRQVNQDNNSLVIETDRREMITVRAEASTPVYYRNDVYHVSNLEVGDRIRVEPDSASSTTGDVRARIIDVLHAVQDSGGGPTPSSKVAGLSGRVTRIDQANDIIVIDTGRGETRVDVANATDSSGRRIRAIDLQVGDHVELTGTVNNDFFAASTVRFSDDVFAGGPSTTTPAPARVEPQQLGAVTIYGTVALSLAASPQLVVRDNQNHTYTLYVLEDFVVRGKTSGYTTAGKLKDGDSVIVKAYRDADGNYIAQTIKLK